MSMPERATANNAQLRRSYAVSFLSLLLVVVSAASCALRTAAAFQSIRAAQPTGVAGTVRYLFPRYTTSQAAAGHRANRGYHRRRHKLRPLYAGPRDDTGGWSDDSQDANKWRSSDDDSAGQQDDWQETLKRKQDGEFWSSFTPSDEGEGTAGDDSTTDASASKPVTEEQEADAWLDTLASLSAEEVQFNLKEAERADTARKMEEWGFDQSVIASALDVATDSSLEDADQVEGMKAYMTESYLDEVDLETVESHTMVEKDDETGDPIRSQMVYVDEHACIGCTNCAMIAQVRVVLSWCSCYSSV